MIVVEGPDGAGKTTLATILAEEMGREYRRPPSLSSTEGPNAGVVDWWREELWADDAHRMGGVYDRTFVISEPIYSEIMNRSPLVQPAEFRELFDRFIDCYPLVIFCLPSWSFQKKNLEEKARDRLKGLNMKLAAKVLWAYYEKRRYFELFEEAAKCRCLTYDLENMHEITPAVMQFLSEEANRVGRPVS